MCEEDMTLTWQNDQITHETVLQGMGDQHIDVAIHRAQVKFQVGLVPHEPRIPYREGITRKASAQYRHKKQSGGAGQFGEVHLRIEPYHEGDFEFTDELVGMNLSKSYLPPIEKGIKATMERGAFAGYPMNNVKVIVYDGKEHEVDSKPVAFEIAGREAFKLAVQSAGPVLFEPIMEVRVTVPDANMGDVMSDLNTRRGRVQGTETEHGSTTVIAHVPMSEMTGGAVISRWNCITTMSSRRMSRLQSSKPIRRKWKPRRKSSCSGVIRSKGRDVKRRWLRDHLLFLRWNSTKIWLCQRSASLP
jgi:elongation factor G